MNKTLQILLVISAVSLLGCDKDKKPAADGPAEKAEGKTAEKKAPEKAAPVAEKAPAEKAAAATPSVALAMPEWGIEMMAAKGAKLASFEKGDELPGSATIEGACGDEDIEIYRHEASALQSQFKNSTGNMEHSAGYPVKEVTAKGFKVKKHWTPPLGKVWTGEAAVVLDKHVYVCGLGTMLGVEKESVADCAIAACASLSKSAK